MVKKLMDIGIYIFLVRATANSNKYILYLAEDITIPSAGKQAIETGITKLGNKWFGHRSEMRYQE